MGELRTRKRGNKWEYSFEGAKINGKRNTISKSGFRTKGECVAAGTKALNEYNNAGQTFTPSELSINDFFIEWLKFCKLNYKETTYEAYEKQVRLYIIPVIGEYKLRALTTPVLQSLINNLIKEKKSRNTIVNVKAKLTGAMEYAIDQGYISYNPTGRIKIPSLRSKEKFNSKERIPLSENQVNEIFKRFPVSRTSYIPLLIGYRCGLRIAEAFALTWDDLDLVNGKLSVNKQIQWIDHKWKFKSPKYDSNRIIDMDFDN